MTEDVSNSVNPAMRNDINLYIFSKSKDIHLTKTLCAVCHSIKLTYIKCQTFYGFEILSLAIRLWETFAFEVTILTSL